MKCAECPEFKECHKQHNLTIKRKHCVKAKEEKLPSRADRIRAMTDEELAKLLYDPDSLSEKYCKNLPECGELLDAPGGIPEEKCIGCMLQWLRQPAEEGGCDG